ncbi:hypothetical protein MPER_00278, partial [Moniliophthora perniciosa FA553]
QYASPAEDTYPTYLFLDALPMSISELISWNDEHSCKYFWSFDENGQSKLSEEECKQRGLPTLSLEMLYDAQLVSWSADVYAALHDWQIVRGFDPATTDWARSQGYSELEFPWRSELETQLKGESFPVVDGTF